MIGPNIFESKKKVKLENIPIEVVEISKKSEVKKKDISKKILKTVENKPDYTPPKALKKPKPPEFLNPGKKKEVIKIKEKVQKQIIPEEKNDRLSSILNTIEKIKNQKNTKQKKQLENIDKDPKEPDYISEKLTISEIDTIRRQFIPCWTVPAGIKDVTKITVSVKLKLDSEGNVVGSKLLKNYGIKSKSYKTFSESVLRAVKHPTCKRIKVPKKKYDVWKNITLNFDVSEIK